MGKKIPSFPAIGDAAYRQHAGGGPSHGDRQPAQKNWQKSLVWFHRYPVGQTDIQTDRQTDAINTIIRKK